MLPRPTDDCDDVRLKACIKARVLGRPELAPRLGRFSLVRMLGQGANGVVYEARDEQTDTVVALKILLHPDATAIGRFKREFRGLAHVQHENLVQLHELFCEDNEWFFTMELVVGEHWVSYVRHAGELPDQCDTERVRTSLSSVLAGVQAIHDAGHLHCDIKSSNVLITPDGHVVILDFGLLRLRDSALAMERARYVPGTPEYTAPELRRSATPTRASDAYAIGVMLFQALAGRLPGTVRDLDLDVVPALEHVRGNLPAPVGDVLVDVCLGLLRPDPHERLTVAAALERLGHDARSTPRSAPQAGSHFIGRHTELAALHGAYERTATSGTQLVFVHGPSGIGKSALCDRFVAGLDPDVLVLRGRCHERESLPYRAFDDIVEALARHLARVPGDVLRELQPDGVGPLVRVFPALATCLELSPQAGDMPASPVEARQQAFTAFKELFRRLALRRRIVLLVDDLQWSDVDSSQLLLELCKPPAAPTLLYVGCYRGDTLAGEQHLPECVARIADYKEATHVPLAALDSAQAAELVHSVDVERALSSANVQRIVREAAGNPLIIGELVHYVRGDGADYQADASLGELLGQRIATMSSGARAAIWLLAVAARPVPQATLGLALHDKSSEPRDIRALEALRLVTRTSDNLWIVGHDRLREEIARRIPAPDLVHAHHALARAYEGSAIAEHEWLVEHWAGAGETARALVYAASAAQHASSKLAFNRAAVLYERAIELCSHDADEQRRFHASRATALTNAGRSAEAAEAFMRAARGATGSVAITWRCGAMQHYLRCGQREDGTTLLKELISEVGIQYPQSSTALARTWASSRVRARLYRARQAWRPSSGATSHDRLTVLESVFRETAFSEPALGAVFLSLFRAEAERVQDQRARFMALAWETYSLTRVLGSRGTRMIGRRLETLQHMANQLATPYATGTVALIRGAAALHEGRPGEAATQQELASRIFRNECPGTDWEQSVCISLHYAATETAGPVDKLGDDVVSRIQKARDSRDRFSAAILSRAYCQGLAAQDRHQKALEFITARLDEYEPRLDTPRWVLTVSVADALTYCGQHAKAWELHERMWQSAKRTAFALSDSIQFAVHYRRSRLALALTAETRNPRLIAIAERHARSAARSKRLDCVSVAAYIRAALASQRGEYPLAIRLLEQAEASARRAGNVVPAECLKRHRGQLSGDPTGQLIVGEADQALATTGVRNPSKWAASFVAGIVFPGLARQGARARTGAGRGGALVRGALEPGFGAPSLVIESADRELVSMPVTVEQLGAGIVLPAEARRVQLVAESESGPRPVAELALEAAPPVTWPDSAPNADAGTPRQRSSEALLGELVAFRRTQGAGMLRPNRLLAQSAQRHAERVCELGKLAHRLEGEDPELRLQREHVAARGVGEVLARAQSSDAAVRVLLASASHRLALSRREFTDVGIGQAADRQGQVCLVVLLASWPRRIP